MNKIFFPDFFGRLITIEIIVPIRQTYTRLVTLGDHAGTVLRKEEREFLSAGMGLFFSHLPLV